MNAGAVGFLSKPFDEEAFISSLETALKRNETPAMAQQ
jgi:FixJ family two-component response regulator